MGLVFTYLLCYGGSVVALFNPFVGLCIYVCFAIVRPELMWFWSVPQGNYSRVIAIALLVGWAFRGCGNWTFGRGRAILAALVGYWASTVLCTAQAVESAPAWEAVEILTKIVLPCVVALTIINSLQQAKVLAWVILLSQAY